MNTQRIRSCSHPDWAELWQMYEASFPAGERRTLQGQAAVIDHEKYFLEEWLNERGEFVGFTASWIYERFRYLEHFAVDPLRRNSGYGKQILTEWMNRPGPTILLEIDPPTDELSRRRQGFYQRLGFHENPFDHSHPSYQDGTGRVPLIVFSYPDTIDTDLYNEFVQKQVGEMIAHLY